MINETTSFLFSINSAKTIILAIYFFDTPFVFFLNKVELIRMGIKKIILLQRDYKAKKILNKLKKSPVNLI